MPLTARTTRLTLVTSLTITAVATAVAASAATAAHSGQRSYRQTPDAYSPRLDTPVAPGVDLASFSSAATGGTAHSDVLTVDLSHAGVRANVLGSRVTDIAPVSRWAQRSGAVAAINGDYYDIGASQAPQGPVIRDGRMLKGTRSGQSITGQGTDGRMRTSTVRLNGTVTWGGGRSHALDVYDSSLTGIMPRNGLAVLDGGWGSSPVQFVHAPKQVAVAVVGANHKVLATYPSLKRHLTVPPHGMLVVGTGTYAGIAKLKKGTTVKDTVAVTTDSYYPFRWGLGAGLVLMRNGGVVHNYPNDNDPHAARTAIGWKADGRTLIVITVERGAGSVGQGVNEIADEMAAQGATDAVLLDGGGSTTLMARQQGAPTSGQVGAVQDGYERSVPNGIGIYVPRGSGGVYGFTTALDAGTVFPGLHRQVGFNGWDEWYGPAAVNPASVSLSTDNAGLLAQSAPGQVKALRSGVGHVLASAPTSAPGAAGTATAGVVLQVLQPLATLGTRGAMRVMPGATAPLVVTGADGNGAQAPILGSDISADYDHSLLSVSPAGNGVLAVHALRVAEGPVTTVRLTVQGISTSVVVHIGYGTVKVLAPAGRGVLHTSGGRTRIVPVGRGGAGLLVAPVSKTSTSYVNSPSRLPATAVRVGVTAVGDGLRHALGIVIVDAGGHQHRLSLGTVSSKRAQRFEVQIPSGSTLTAITVGKASGRHGGAVALTEVVARI